MTNRKNSPTKTSTPVTKPRNPAAFEVKANTPEEQAIKGAELSTMGGLNAALVHAYLPIDAVGVPAIHAAMERQSAALLTDGDRIHQAEAMLLNQAAALQAMFIDLASRAKLQNNREWIQTMTGLALRAQTNCTQTLKALGELRSPRQAVFARQANIAHGHQQVNNNSQQAVSSENTRTGTQDGAIAQNQLLEQDHGKWLDTGVASTSGRIDSHMEAVGDVHRADNT